MVFPELSGVWRCAWPAPVAAFLGAAVDEWHHAGFTVFMTLCQSSSPLPWQAASLQAELMPAMVTALLAVMAGQWLQAWMSRTHRPATLLACQASCLLVMVLAGGICAALATTFDSRAARLVAMGIVDLAGSVSLAGALVLGGIAVSRRSFAV